LLIALAVVGGGAALARWGIQHWTFDPTPLKQPWNDAPYITTPMDVVEKMLEVAEVRQGDVLYDLGCGDGRIAVTAAEKYGCRSSGFDIDPERIRDSLENARRRGVEDLTTFEQRDVFTLDLSEVDVAAMYLLPRFMTRLVPQFNQMRPGSRIVAHDFAIAGIPPDKEVKMISQEDGKEHTVYLWITPLQEPEAPPAAEPP
jgi:ribosomal protein L11 methylase PrmA